jgi:hypothetical protein
MMDTTSVILIKGKDIVDALENGVSQWPKLEGRFPQVSGIKFRFNSSLPIGKRVLRDTVHVAGSKVDLEREYRLTTKEYLTMGKDGYTAFLNGKTLTCGEEAPFLPTVMLHFFDKLINRTESSKRQKADGEPQNGTAKKMLHDFKQLDEYLAYDDDGTSTITIGIEGRIVNVHDTENRRVTRSGSKKMLEGQELSSY